MVVKPTYECSTNSGALFVDRVQQRVRHILYTLYRPVTHSVGFQFHIYLRQLLAIVRQMLKQDTFWMIQE